jgi:hypothetical protein
LKIMNKSSLSSNNWRGGQSQKTDPSLARVLLSLFGLVMLMLASQPFFNFPIVGFWYLPLAAIYLFLLLVVPRLWLLVLPVATVLIDFTPWTGRSVYNEFDLLMLTTLASGLLYNRFRYRVFAPTPAMVVLACYIGVVILGYSAWRSLVLPPLQSWSNPYYSGEYSYKVLKGMIWGISLVPMWGYLLAVDKQRAVNALVIGVSLAALALGLAVLWERGSLAAFFYGSAWYDSHFSVPGDGAPYRVTALFSDMHTGGDVIGGVLLLLLPVTLYAIAWGKAPPLRLLGGAGLLALAYVALAGSTGAASMAFFMGIAICVSLMHWYRQISGMPPVVPVKWLILACSMIALTGIFAFLIIGGDEQGRGDADPDGEESHLAAVAKSYRPGIWHQLVGNGVGTYPVRFIAAHPEMIRVLGDFNIPRGSSRESLHLEGGRDLMLGQRVNVKSDTIYTLDLRYAATAAGTLAVSLCERNLLYATNFEPPCVYGTLDLENTEQIFLDAQVQINSGKLGAESFPGSWPTVLSIHYPPDSELLEIDAVKLSVDGRNLLSNSSFSDGLDHWFYYNDVSHAPWHIGNVLTQVWFDTGWLGLGLFLGLVFLLARATLKRHEVDSLAPVYLSAVLTVLLLGIFGNPMDSARVSWIFWFFLAAGLARLRVGKLSGKEKWSRHSRR